MMGRVSNPFPSFWNPSQPMNNMKRGPKMLTPLKCERSIRFQFFFSLWTGFVWKLTSTVAGAIPECFPQPFFQPKNGRRTPTGGVHVVTKMFKFSAPCYTHLLHQDAPSASYNRLYLFDLFRVTGDCVLTFYAPKKAEKRRDFILSAFFVL